MSWATDSVCMVFRAETSARTTAGQFESKAPWTPDYGLTSRKRGVINSLVKLFTMVGLVLLPVTCFSQAFQDLDFESVQIVHTGDFYPDSVALSNALPHWQGTVQGSPVSFAIYNGVVLDYNAVGIYDANSGGATPPPMFGKYSAYLESSYGGPSDPADAELSQTGLIPSNAKSIWFATTPYSLVGNPNLQPNDLKPIFSVNGQSISYTAMDVETNYILWAADISTYANTTAEIRFAVKVASGVAIGLDDISFSPEVVPEPTTLGLTAMALTFLGLGFGLRRRK